MNEETQHALKKRMHALHTQSCILMCNMRGFHNGLSAEVVTQLAAKALEHDATDLWKSLTEFSNMLDEALNE